MKEENILHGESDRKRNYYSENFPSLLTLQKGHCQQVCVTGTAVTAIIHRFNGRR